MRKHGWQLPYHPLQVVAMAVFLALGFAFYVFFAPFVGKKLFQYIAMGVYTPLIMSAIGLYVWCAAADPADPGVFKSKKFLKVPGNKKGACMKESKADEDLTPSIHSNAGENERKDTDAMEENINNRSPQKASFFSASLAFLPCALICNFSSSQNEFPEQKMSEDGMFYCSLCEVEVFKYSKHCRVCDKCVDHFDHHCRWLNNCIGKRNYRMFFTLMVSSLLLLIIQWSTGIILLICCFLDRKRFDSVIASQLGSSFTMAPFIIVVVVCTILAMVATLPLGQLFFFHILLIKKGITTYDYIIALREQEQQENIGQQSPQMSPATSFTGLSSASSFNTFQRGAWCTPPRLLVEDQFDVVPPDSGSVSSMGKKSVEERIKRKNPPAVKISPWALSRLNAEQVSKVAAEARKKSKILQPVVRRDTPHGHAGGGTFGEIEHRMVPNKESRGASKRIRLPIDLPPERMPKGAIGGIVNAETSTHFAPLQLEARSGFHTSQAVSNSAGVVASSPDSSSGSPGIHLHPFRLSSSVAEESRELVASGLVGQQGISLASSISDGYDASGGEDSDRVPSSTMERPINWGNLPFSSADDGRVIRLKASSSSSSHHKKRP